MTAQTEEYETCVSVYPCTDGVLEWMAETLQAVDRKVFEHFQRLKPVLLKADRNERGEISDFVFEAALRAFNERHRTQVTRTDLTCLNADHIMLDAGDWVVFTDDPEAIIRSDQPNIELAAYGAPTEVRWALLYLPKESTVTVYRSPRVELREFWAQEGLAEALTYLPAAKGQVRGQYPAWVLPPGIEGLIKQETHRG